MTTWRTIFTDSESLTGVAPVCDNDETSKNHTREDEVSGAPWFDDKGVYDCCPHPHIECWSETVAADLAARLSLAEAELCS